MLELSASVKLPDIGWLAPRFNERAERDGYVFVVFEQWPTDAKVSDSGLDITASFRGPWDDSAIITPDGAVAHVNVCGGTATTHVAAKSQTRAAAVMQDIRDALPALERTDASMIPLAFWCYTPNGPSSISRVLTAPSWDEIATNYAERTAAGLSALFDPGFRPGSGGQLILWHGEPGTGKTTALRALVREWQWADACYVTDPDQFFGYHADYMLQVLTGGEAKGEVADAEPRWRLLILEDTGELLQPDARRDVGQALSRFLNAVDGLIGQGLRILTLVTTNEDARKLHPAVIRPGRCAANVEFQALDVHEARAWLDGHSRDPEIADGPMLLADLYAEVEHPGRTNGQVPVGFA